MIGEKEYLAAMTMFAEVRDRLIENILNLPDNPEIKRIDERCFIIRRSQLWTHPERLQSNWSPDYYDFKNQYKKVAHELRKANPENLLNRLREILKARQIMIYGGAFSAGYSFHLNPMVVSNIVKAVGLEEEFNVEHQRKPRSSRALQKGKGNRSGKKV